jgi:SAM-dependent methyltransferase
MSTDQSSTTRTLDPAEATPVRAAHPSEAGQATLLRDVGSAYRDGAEDALLEMVRSTEDLGSLNEDLHVRATTWAERYHLDRTRANVLRAFDLAGAQRVLEVGAGCGAMSRYLAEVCEVVDALEPVPARAAVAAARLRDLPGARVFTGELADLPDEPSYDLIVVIGVVEYVGGGTADEAPYLAFLEEIRRRLRPGGRLLLAIENKLGVKYLAGAPEDHSDRAYDSLEGYPLGAPARTFDRAALLGLFRSAGFTPAAYSAFPDYKLTRVVMSEELMAHPSQLAARLPRFPSPDWQTARDFGPNEELLWRSLVEAGQGAEHGNSFVIVAGVDDTGAQLWPQERRAAFFTTERRPGRATRTVVDERAGELVFERTALGARRDDGGPAHRVAGGPLVAGHALLDELAVRDTEFATTTLHRWRAMVEASAAEPDGVAIDLVPHNLLVDPETAELRFIDDEWRSAEWTADDVVARGLIWLAERLSTIPSVWHTRPTRRALLGELAAMIDFRPEGDWVAAAVRREAVLQVELLRLSREHAEFETEVARTEKELVGLLELPMTPQRPKLGPLIAERDEARTLLHEAQQEHDRRVRALHDEVTQAHATLAEVLGELTSIKESAGYRALQRSYRAAERVAPPDTRRRALYARVGKAFRRRAS